MSGKYLILLFQVSTVLKAQIMLNCVLQILFESLQGVPTYRTAYHVHLNIGVNLVGPDNGVCVCIVLVV